MTTTFSNASWQRDKYEDESHGSFLFNSILIAAAAAAPSHPLLSTYFWNTRTYRRKRRGQVAVHSATSTSPKGVSFEYVIVMDGEGEELARIPTLFFSVTGHRRPPWQPNFTVYLVPLTHTNRPV